MTAVAIKYRAEILESIASGKRLSDIAPKYGVIPNAISKVLKDDPEYKLAFESSYERRIDKAEDGILEAIEQVDVSRARAYHEALKWRAGVDCEKFRERRTIDLNATVTVDHTLTFEAGNLLESIRASQQLEQAKVIEHDDDVSD